jgi:hypothetical protein
VYCEEHRAVEHREDQQQDDEDEDEDDHGGACAWQLLPAGDVPLATPIAAGPVQWTEVPAPEPPALGGGARAPPLSFAPKTSPPA